MKNASKKDNLLTFFIISLRENESAYDRYRIRPRILVNVEDIDTSTEILGTKVCHYDIDRKNS